MVRNDNRFYFILFSDNLLTPFAWRNWRNHEKGKPQMPLTRPRVEPDSSVRTAAENGLNDWDSIPGTGLNFSLLLQARPSLESIQPLMRRLKLTAVWRVNRVVLLYAFHPWWVNQSLYHWYSEISCSLVRPTRLHLPLLNYVYECTTLILPIPLINPWEVRLKAAVVLWSDWNKYVDIFLNVVLCLIGVL